MDINNWIKGSMTGKVLSFLTNSKSYAGSYFYNILKGIGNTLGRWYNGCAVRKISLSVHWEKNALANSHIFREIPKIGEKAESVIDLANNLLLKSRTYSLVDKLCYAVVESPFKTMSFSLLPAILVNTGLKSILFNIKSRDLVLRSVMMVMLFIFSFVQAPLREIISSSFLIKIMKKMWGAESKGQCVLPDCRTFPEMEFRVLALISALLGVLSSYLPMVTFLKLIGVVMFSTLIYRWPGWGIVVTAFILPMVATSYTVAITGITFISVILNYKRFKPGLPSGIVPASIFVSVACISAVFSFARSDSLNTLPLYIAYFMIYYVTAVLYKDKKILKISLISQILSTSLVALYGIYQYFFLKISTSISWVDVTQFPELRTRVYSTLENPNVLAEYLVLVIPLLLAILWVVPRLRQKTVVLGLLSIMFLCLVLTFSRGAWIGMALAVFAFASMKAPALALLTILIAMVAPTFLPPVIANRIASIGSLEDSSNAYRISIWIAVARIIKDYWFTGVGLGLIAFSRIYRDYMIAGTYALHSHNLFLQLAAEMGVLGVIAFLWLFGSIFSQVFFRVKIQDKSTYLLAGATAALMGHLLHGLFEYIWYSPKVIFAYWMTLGMISALLSYTGKDSKVVVP